MRSSALLLTFLLFFFSILSSSHPAQKTLTTIHTLSSAIQDPPVTTPPPANLHTDHKRGNVHIPHPLVIPHHHHKNCTDTPEICSQRQKEHDEEATRISKEVDEIVKKGHRDVGLIIGAVVGGCAGLVFLVLLVIFGLWVWRRNGVSRVVAWGRWKVRRKREGW